MEKADGQVKKVLKSQNQRRAKSNNEYFVVYFLNLGL